jgi:hypothetical protein
MFRILRHSLLWVKYFSYYKQYDALVIIPFYFIAASFSSPTKFIEKFFHSHFLTHPHPCILIPRNHLQMLFSSFRPIISLIGKVKVKLSLCFSLVKHHAMRHVWKQRYCSTILDLGNRWRWVSASRSGFFTPRERGPIPTGYEVGWTQDPVRTLWKK